MCAHESPDEAMAASAAASAAAARAAAARASAAVAAAAAAAAAVGVPLSGSMSSVSSADEPPSALPFIPDKDGRADAPLPRTSSASSSVSSSSVGGAGASPPGSRVTSDVADAPRADAPRADAPRADAPRADAPRADAPRADAPRADAPRADAPRADAPPADAPRADAPPADAPPADAEAAESAAASPSTTDDPADADGDSDVSGASLARPRMSTTVAAPLGALVTLHVYDLVDADHPSAVPALNTALWLTGIGLFHTGVVVNDVEYTYAGHWDLGVTGVVEGVPRAAPGAVFRTAISYGRVDRGTVDVDEVLDEVADAYEGAAYNLLTRNCNVFCDDLLRRLTGRGSPGWVNRLAGLAVRVRCLLPAGFDDPLSGPGSGRAADGGAAAASDDDDDRGSSAARGVGRRGSAAGSDGGGVGAFRGDAGQAVELDAARGSGSIVDVAPLVAFVHRGGGGGGRSCRVRTQKTG
ncbi:hypothetical protein MMPV_006749 [Pyropia vietnamensis]